MYTDNLKTLLQNVSPTLVARRGSWARQDNRLSGARDRLVRKQRRVTRAQPETRGYQRLSKDSEWQLIWN